MIPPALVGPFADLPVARMRGDRALVAVNLVRAVAAALTALVLAVGAPPGLAFILAGVCAAADAVVRPIQNGLMPALARSPSELIAANVTSSIGEGAGAFVGPLVGGAVLVGFGPAAACVVVAFVFAAAAVVLVGLRFEHELDARGGVAAGHGGIAVARAFRALRRQPDVALVFLDFGGQTFVRGMLTTLIVVAAIQLLDLGDSGVGLLNAAVGLGGLIGAVGAVGLTRIPRLGAAFLVALAFWGLPIAVIGAWPLVPLAIGAMFVTGVSNAMLDVSGFTVLQRGMTTAERVPVFGLFEGMVAFSVAAGGIVASLLVEAFGAQVALGIAGAILPILAAASWPRVSRIDRRLTVPEQTAGVLRAIPLFSPLPMTALDRLAGAARPVSFAAGEILMRQGDPGETYIAIASGTVTIDVDGRVVTGCAAGEGIGEIALLRRVPRTATATAATPVTGYALDAIDFLGAIAGPASASAADSMIAERMAR
jgi:predicted MFS family arabinose efflux permease